MESSSKTVGGVATAEIVARIRADYIDGRMFSRLPSERQLAEKYGWSRTVIRPALGQLEATGLLRTLPGGRIRYIERAVAAEAPPEGPLGPRPSFGHVAPQRRVQIRLMAMDLCPGTCARTIKRWNRWVRQLETSSPRLDIVPLPWKQAAWSGSEPFAADLVQAPVDDAGILRRRGVIQELDGLLVADTSLNPQRLNRDIWSEGLVGGVRLAVPMGTVLPLLATSRDTWRRFGEATIPAAWSWQDCLPVFERFQAETGQPALQLHALDTLFASCGFDPLATAMEDQPRLARLLERILAGSHLATGRIDLGDTAAARLGFTPVRTSSIGKAVAEYGERLVFLPYPCEPEGWLPRVTLGCFLTSEATAPIEVWQCIRHLLTLPVQRELARSGHQYPLLAAAANAVWTAPESDGGADILGQAMARSRPSAIPQLRRDEAESRLYGPELHAWHAGQESADGMFLRLRMMLNLLLNQAADGKPANWCP